MTTLQSSKSIKAILLCGIGQPPHNFYPFNVAPTSTLPILNVPLLHYQFRLLERSGFDGCEVICFKKDIGTISSCADDYRENLKSSFKVKIHQAPLATTYDTPVCEVITSLMKYGYKTLENGTVEQSAKLRLSIDSDVLILPSDVIATDPLTKLCAYHHHKRATFTMMLTQPPVSSSTDDASSGKKSGKDTKDKAGGKQPTVTDPRLHKQEYPLRIGINHDDGRLLSISNIYDDSDLQYDNQATQQTFPLHKNVLRQMNSFTLYTNLKNPAIYAFSREAIELLNKYPTRLKTLAELAVLLVEMQFAQLPPPPISPELQSLQYNNNEQSLYSSFIGTGKDIASTTLLSAPSLDRHHSYLNGTFQYKQAPMDEDSTDMNDIATTADETTMLSTAPSAYLTAHPMSESPANFNVSKKAEIEPLYKYITPLSCFAILPPASSLILRCNDLNAYQFVNKKFSETGSIYADMALEKNNTAEILSKCTAEAILIQQQLEAEAQAAAAVTPEPDTAAATPAGKGNKKQPQQGKGGKKGIKGPPRTNITGATWFGEHCQVGQGCIIVNSIIGHDVVIKNGVTIKDSIIMNGAVLGENCKVESSILGADVEINPNSELFDRQIVSYSYDDESHDDDEDEDEFYNDIGQ